MFVSDWIFFTIILTKYEYLIDSFYGYYTGGENYFTHIASDYYDFRNDSQPNCGLNCSIVATDAYQTYSTHLFSDEAIEVIKK